MPTSIQYKIGASSLLNCFRDVFFRPNGNIAIIGGFVNWENLNFYFLSPYKIFYKAQNNGIENIICRCALTVLEDSDTAIDIGANYGFITTVMGKYLFPRGHVVSFEIDSSICKVLNQTIIKNQLSNNVTLIEKGASSKESIKYTTIDVVVSEHKLKKIKFIKIDVDGDDFDVLVGAYNTLNNFHPTVVIEMHKNQRKIYEFLISCGYQYFINQSNETVPIDIDSWPPNLIASNQKLLIPQNII